jgi:hypothetical protein
MNRLCDQTDCLLHPDYELFKKEKKVSTNVVYLPYPPNEANDANISWSSVSSSSIVWSSPMTQAGLATKAFKVSDENEDSKMVFTLDEDLKIPLECLFCEHLKKIDMKKEILLKKAKKLLEK